MEVKIPEYWKSRLSDADEIVKIVKKGKVEEFTSAGGRRIYRISYGKNKWNRTANYSSACGAGKLECYADKKREGVKPTLFLSGCIHGFEFEGSVALLNLIKLIETGTDFKGDAHPELSEMINDCNLVIIPFVNPDGRDRVPYLAANGLSYEEFRSCNQGQWSDGGFCEWPDCKELHPMRGERVGKLGGYYNDNGINIMHDNFPFPEAEETRLLYRTVDEFVPELTILLHGAISAPPFLMPPSNVHPYFMKKIEILTDRLSERCEKENLHIFVPTQHYVDEIKWIHKANLISGLTLSCGEICITYESNQGLMNPNSRSGCVLSFDEIYKHHMLLFAESYHYSCDLFKERNK